MVCGGYGYAEHYAPNALDRGKNAVPFLVHLRCRSSASLADRSKLISPIVKHHEGLVCAAMYPHHWIGEPEPLQCVFIGVVLNVVQCVELAVFV